jgi:diguanylate cyclase (GGDEF)-like protein
MRLETTFLRGKVARRIFILFALAAFLPMLAMAVLAYSQVRSIITSDTHSRLIKSSKEFAIAVDQRLVSIQANLQQTALLARHGKLQPNEDLVSSLEAMYTGMAIVGPAAHPIQILGHELDWPAIPESELESLKQGKPVLLVKPIPGQKPEILMLQLIDAHRPGHFALLAELNQTGLWGDRDDYSFVTGQCMFTENAVLLFCSQPQLEKASAQLASWIGHFSIPSQVRIGDETRMIGQWKLFLKPQFDTESSWFSFSVQPVADAMLPVYDFSHNFNGIVILTLLIAVLLSISLIRRTMGPLEKLIDGTRRIADKNFDHPVDIRRNDEFGELASSFNEMASRVGSHLGTLQVLSRIDQVILAKADIDPIFEIVLPRIRKLGATGFIGIVVPDKDATGAARIYFLGPGQDNKIEMNRITIEASLLPNLAAQADGFWLDSPEAIERYCLLTPLTTTAKYFILPTIAEGSLNAFVCLEFFAHEQLLPDVRTQIKDMCDRIGVALSSVARDEQLIYQARHDPLTSLPNRLLFKERLSGELSLAHREHESLALLFIDLDHFKNVNDTLGHSVGDELLLQVGKRLRLSNRESDTVARLGGDEFAVIVPSINGTHRASTVAKHILQNFAAPFEISGLKLHVNASIGIAVSGPGYDDFEILIRNADTAMYRAKEMGRGRFVYFEELMNKQAVEFMTLEREMRQGLLNGEFELHFQPKLDLRFESITGAEALIRWNHPTRGLVSPVVFIGIAEDSGLIEELGKQVIWGACKQHAILRMAGICNLRIAVNISVKQFQNNDLTAIFMEAMHATDTPASGLEIEVTESLLMGNDSNAIMILHELRNMGLKVTIDDFGTGYSSISYLKNLPIDVLKIDKSFIDNIAHDESAGAIVKVIINLAHTLGKSVVAEGVETLDQLRLLREWQCESAQGYYLSKPLHPDRLLQFLREYNGITM